VTAVRFFTAGPLLLAAVSGGGGAVLFLQFGAVDWPEAKRFLDEIGPGARRELMRVLDSPAEVRADVIRQFFHRKGGGEMAELLILLEEREWARQAMVEALRRLETRK